MQALNKAVLTSDIKHETFLKLKHLDLITDMVTRIRENLKLDVQNKILFQVV